MKIRTSANIEKSIHERICDAAELCGVNKQQIVHILLKIMIREKPLEMKFNRTVKYQERRHKDLWKCFHLELSEVAYESSVDLRKLMKLSVSYLLSYAVMVYLERVIEEILSGYAEDNYPDIYSIFIHHSPERSTHTAFHTLINPEDCQNHLSSSP